MKQRIRINESQLNQIVAESVEICLMEQGLGDRLRGAFNGFRQGNSQMQQTQQNLDAANQRYTDLQSQNDASVKNYSELKSRYVRSRNSIVKAMDALSDIEVLMENCHYNGTFNRYIASMANSQYKPESAKSFEQFVQQLKQALAGLHQALYSV